MVAFTSQIEEWEMDAFEELSERLKQQGYWVHLSRRADTAKGDPAWECELRCGVDVMEANLSRPRAYGPTAYEALEDAVLKIHKPKAKIAQGPFLVSGLPRSN